MGEAVYTFGEYLGILLREKNISIKEFTDMTQMKSRNSVHRLINNECNLKTIRKFYDMIIGHGLFHLSSENILGLEQSLEVSTHGRYKYLARKEILKIFTRHTQVGCKPSVTYLTNQLKQDFRLDFYFDTFRDYDSINILLFDLHSKDLSNSLLHLVNNCSHNHIHIDQLVTINNSAYTTAKTFTSTYKLFNHPSYNAYYYNRDDGNSTNRYYPSLNSQMVIKKTQGALTLVDLVHLDEHGQFLLTTTQNAIDLFNFYQQLFKAKSKIAKNIRLKIASPNSANALAKLCRYLLSIEKESSAIYSLMPNICYQMIPPTILYSLLKDCNYLGLSVTDPIISQLSEDTIARHIEFFRSGKKRTCFVTKRGMYDLIRTRTLTDHHMSFRAFTPNEVQTILSSIYDQMLTNNSFDLRILVDDFALENLEFVYYKANHLYIYDSCCGYDQDLDSFILEDPSISALFEDFFEHEVLLTHALSVKDSRDFVRSLIDH